MNLATLMLWAFSGCGSNSLHLPRACDIPVANDPTDPHYLYSDASRLDSEFSVHKIEIQFRNGVLECIADSDTSDDANRNCAPKYGVEIAGEGSYIVATEFLVDGISLGSYQVVVKPKGNGSWEASNPSNQSTYEGKKRSFIVNFCKLNNDLENVIGIKNCTSEYTPTSGEQKINLLSMVQDETKIRLLLGYKIYQLLGIPAPMVGYACVTASDEADKTWALGPYAIVESIDGDLLKRLDSEQMIAGRDNPYVGKVKYNIHGTIQEGMNTTEESIEYEGDDPEEARAKIDACKDLVGSIDYDGKNLMGDFEYCFDTASLFRLWAIELYTRNGDGILNNNNFFWYYDISTGKLSPIPWGIDQAFEKAEPNRIRTYVNGCATKSTGKNEYTGRTEVKNENGANLKSYAFGHCMANQTCRARFVGELYAIDNELYGNKNSAAYKFIESFETVQDQVMESLRESDEFRDTEPFEAPLDALGWSHDELMEFSDSLHAIHDCATK